LSTVDIIDKCIDTRHPSKGAGASYILK